MVSALEIAVQTIQSEAVIAQLDSEIRWQALESTVNVAAVAGYGEVATLCEAKTTDLSTARQLHFAIPCILMSCGQNLMQHLQSY
ncbi:hypothetical protein GCM10009304_14170 [Pseudomonas matsuisoli]|uniref:Uncharacterized protein n=1 Tax=Pseudomonas matsuisoli TaxID=1515666 RepID=A0A917PS32_9PSED|nr:hypothetical protein GCM10009304_14170 [Pseudomonas matsuisoli]